MKPEDMTTEQLIAWEIQNRLTARRLHKTERNINVLTREILNELVRDGSIESYTWVGEHLKLRLQ